MSSEAIDREILDLKDPKIMRALAHPVRMALLDLLSVHDTLTATQASELLGESPANCAFHLRTLGKYGFVLEAGGGRGRERPWRSKRMKINVSAMQEDPQAAIAADLLGQAWNDRWMERARRELSGQRVPEGWQDARQASRSLKFITADELVQFGRDVIALASRFEDRKDPATRPAGALPVELLFFGYPLTELAMTEQALTEQALTEQALTGKPSEDATHD
jgi:DNA-binding transcriptional ArsR family regulator